MRYRIVLEKDVDGGFVATAPSLPGCISQGDTEKEALENITEAISLHMEAQDSIRKLTKGGRPLSPEIRKWRDKRCS